MLKADDDNSGQAVNTIPRYTGPCTVCQARECNGDTILCDPCNALYEGTAWADYFRGED